MAGATKQGTSRASTRSATASAASGNYSAQGNKLGFIRTAGSGKRKSITDPEVRENSRQKMSTGEPASYQTGSIPAQKGALAPPKVSLKTSKLPLKPNKCGTGGVPTPEPMQVVEQAMDPTPPTSAAPSSSSGGHPPAPAGTGDDASRLLHSSIIALTSRFETVEAGLNNVQLLLTKYDSRLESVDNRVKAIDIRKEVELGLEAHKAEVLELVHETIAEESDNLRREISNQVQKDVAKETATLKAELKSLREDYSTVSSNLGKANMNLRFTNGPRPRQGPKSATPEDCDQSSSNNQPHKNMLENNYWMSRRCIKFSPIIGDDTLAGSIKFMRDMLLVDPEDVADQDIVDVRKIKTTRGGALPGECLVFFKGCRNQRPSAVARSKPGWSKHL